jgi:hypothetical protein
MFARPLTAAERSNRHELSRFTGYRDLTEYSFRFAGSLFFGSRWRFCLDAFVGAARNFQNFAYQTKIY